MVLAERRQRKVEKECALERYTKIGCAVFGIDEEGNLVNRSPKDIVTSGVYPKLSGNDEEKLFYRVRGLERNVVPALLEMLSASLLELEDMPPYAKEFVLWIRGLPPYVGATRDELALIANRRITPKDLLRKKSLGIDGIM